VSSLVNRDELDWSLIAENIRLLRQMQNMTQADLARLSGVTEVTIYHAEKGQPVSTRTLKKIAAGMDSRLSAICTDKRLVPDDDQPYVLHREENRVWSVLGDRRRKDRTEGTRTEMDASERRRIATLGFVAGFMHTTQFVMPEGPGLVFIELYSPFEGLFNHTVYNDVVLLCLEGEARVTIKGETLQLAQGDAIGFNAKHLTALEPGPGLNVDDLPVRLLWVGANRLGKVLTSTSKKGP
jgi:transcriptional regulator with XRE-family HTH domain